MRIISLEAENFKVLRAIQIEPTGAVVVIGGKNGAGKSSVLDALWVALAGKAKAPPKPIRDGEEQCRIKLTLGDGDEPELVITRTFNAKEGGRYTDNVKVESGDGRQRFNSPQSMLDELMGAIGFDPLEFIQRKADDQAEMLLALVPLPIDLEALAREDAADYDNRREINRRAESLKGQIEGIVVPDDLPDEAPDREALTNRLGDAANHNSGIERERMDRERRVAAVENLERSFLDRRQDAARLRAEAEGLEAEAAKMEAGAKADREAIDALPALAEPIDTEAVRTELREAESILAGIDARKRRAQLLAELENEVGTSETLTESMAAREKARREALAKAKMPIEGLGFAINEKGKPVVLMNGQPFEQASSAEQIRASVAIAMAANPELRVLRIKDGSLLDDDAMAAIAEQADGEDFQLWIERVGTGGVGIVIENGEIRGAPAKAEAGEEKPARKPKAKEQSKAPEPEPGKLV